MTDDPTEPLRQAASELPDVDAGTSCTQDAFKRGGKAFLYCGPQGGRFKAMFKLGDSRPAAERLAAERPDRFEVGSTAWVTTRFSADEPLPESVWRPWLQESYELSAPKARKRKKA